ncbi:Uncharacterised protein [Streptococcus pneumoniae]|nr:Uncharacterised protein [Streptococcus pneumoniae]
MSRETFSRAGVAPYDLDTFSNASNDIGLNSFNIITDYAW